MMESMLGDHKGLSGYLTVGGGVALPPYVSLLVITSPTVRMEPLEWLLPRGCLFQ